MPAVAPTCMSRAMTAADMQSSAAQKATEPNASAEEEEAMSPLMGSDFCSEVPLDLASAIFSDNSCSAL